MNFTKVILKPIIRLKLTGEVRKPLYNVLRENDEILCSLAVSTLKYSALFVLKQLRFDLMIF